MANARKFTILHSNDIHGDFVAEMKGEKGELIGGLAKLSGYINKVRAEEENVFYVIAGDMVQGSLIDSEWKGISTIEIMNYLAPDVVTLGNHEFDYGLSHLLFLEKMANFPIVNANLYLKPSHKRIMKPFHAINKAGFDVMFIGIITDKIIDALKQDNLVGSFVTLEDAAEEVGRITDAYKNDDIDLTILLTHIGLESDKQLAAMLKPEWGVDMIVGGHSHSVLEKPERVNNILIAQAGVGSKQIGRFDIVVDDDTNSIIDYKWQLVDLTTAECEPDRKLEEYINTFKTEVDRKFGALLCRLSHEHEHHARNVETELGNLLADAFAKAAECDVVFLGSGSIRVKKLGPAITLGDYRAAFPYNDSYHRFTITGAVVRKMFEKFMVPENRASGEGECYQVNSGVKAVYSDSQRKLVSLEINGTPVDDAKEYRVALMGYHLNNSDKYLDVTQEELRRLGGAKVIATACASMLEELLPQFQNEGRKVEGRLQYGG